MKLVAAICLWLAPLILFAQTSQLKFEQSKWPVHTVLHYTKANWDGSNLGFVSVYFKDKDWIESLKWHEGHDQATIVPAKIDHKSFNVVHFQNFRCQEGACKQLGDMQWRSDLAGFILKFGENADTITNVPTYWHSYDFDFASLMTAFLFKNDTTPHEFQRADFHEVNGSLKFGPMGTIELVYQGEVDFNGNSCNLYEIDGPGLNQQGGEIWFDQQTGVLKGFKIKLPDESSYNSVDFKFIGQEEMSNAEWEDFKQAKWQ